MTAASGSGQHGRLFLHRRRAKASARAAKGKEVVREAAAPILAEQESNEVDEFPELDQFDQFDTLDRDEDEDEEDENGTAPPSYAALYDASPPPFRATLQMQIETPGKALLAPPGPSAPTPVPVYVLRDDTAETSSARGQQPAFWSLRASRRSASSRLVAGRGDWGAATVRESDVVSTTTYRFRPGRPPAVVVGPATSSASAPASAWDSFDVASTAFLTRARRVRSRIGTFEWRYADRDERRAVTAELNIPGDVVSSLLVLDRVVQVAVAVDEPEATAAAAAAKKKKTATAITRELRRPVARLVRSAALRSAGSKGSSAGNGGRLQVDLAWMQDLSDGEKLGRDRDMAVVLVVTTCLCMLKREGDRLRSHQMAAIGAAVS